MQLNNVTILPSDSDRCVLYSSKTLNIKAASKIFLAVGINKISLPVEIKPTSGKADFIYLPQSILTWLGLEQVKKVNLLLSGNTIKFGPLIGLLVAQEKLERQSMGNLDPIYEKMIHYVDELGGIFVIFSFHGIDLEHKRVTGLNFYLENDQIQWKSGTFALPEVIYDRSFGKEGRVEGAKLRKQLADIGGVKVFNSFVKLCKLETYRLLEAHQKVSKFILPYAEFNFEKLQEMLDKHNKVFIKPDDLAKGEGMIKVTKQSNDYLIEHHTDDGEIKLTAKELVTIRQFQKRNVSKYLIQKNIDLAKCLGNKYDVRAMLQKNKHNNWEITGLLARVAKESVIVTGPRSGGKVLPLKVALSLSFPANRRLQKKILEDIHYLCIEAGKALEKEYGLLGELGVDIGIDTFGQIWLIEINGKPLKVSMTRLKDEITDAKIFRYPVLFASSLQGFC